MRLPLDNWKNIKRTYTFGVPTFYNNFHIGLDLIVPTGTPIFAHTDGFVTNLVGRAGGNTIHFKDANNMLVRYLHLSKFAKRGKVKKGDIIGYSGNTGLSTAPHIHVDVSKGSLRLNSRKNFIDPEKYFMNKQIKVCLLSNKEYDFSKIIADYKSIGFDIVIERKEYTEKTLWEGKTYKEEQYYEITKPWISRNAHLAQGYDVMAVVVDKKDYLDNKRSNGYASQKQYLGLWFTAICDTGKERKFIAPDYKSIWNGENQVAGTFAHEISHILHMATGVRDVTHELDGKGDILRMHIDGDDFRGWEVKGKTRMFKWKEDRMLEKTEEGYASVVKRKSEIKDIVVPDSAARLFKLAYSKFIPKP